MLTIKSDRTNDSQTRELATALTTGRGFSWLGFSLNYAWKWKGTKRCEKPIQIHRWMNNGTCAATITTVSLTLTKRQIMHLTSANSKLQPAIPITFTGMPRDADISWYQAQWEGLMLLMPNSHDFCSATLISHKGIIWILRWNSK